MILIHTALLCEAQTFIEYYKLKKIHSTPKLYANDTIIVCISGVKSKNTQAALLYVYDKYTIVKAFNIGIAGCNNTNIPIGTLYCTNQKLPNIKSLPLITSDHIITHSDALATSLYDMEGSVFLEQSKHYVLEENIFIFKVVSDYLSAQILEKDYIKLLLSKQKIILDFIKLN